MVQRPPVEPMLAQARETLPLLGPGRMAAQPKFDGSPDTRMCLTVCP